MLSQDKTGTKLVYTDSSKDICKTIFLVTEMALKKISFYTLLSPKVARLCAIDWEHLKKIIDS